MASAIREAHAAQAPTPAAAPVAQGARRRARDRLVAALASIAAPLAGAVAAILSVVLGTAFISGAFVFTASLNKAFDGVLATAYDGMDVVELLTNTLDLMGAIK